VSNYNDGAVWGMVQPSTGLPIGDWQTITNQQTLQPINLAFKLNTPTNPPVETPCVESNGVKLVVDLKSMVLLGGTEIDYVEGLMGAGFKFNNPNVKHSCACGESFSA